MIANLRKFFNRHRLPVIGASIAVTIFSFMLSLNSVRELINNFPDTQGPKQSSGKFVNLNVGSHFPKYRPVINTKLKSIISTHLEKRSYPFQVSIYFKDLTDGSEFGINEEMPILGGSLLKVPLVMGHLKASEAIPGYLKNKIHIKEQNSEVLYSIQSNPPANRIKYDSIYSIDELINFTIVDSDNVAAVSLENFNGKKLLHMVVSDTRIPISTELPPFQSLTVKRYSSFFTALYDASYLDKENSERALKILSNANFKDGLRAGVPENIVMSHKFGEKIDEHSDRLYFNHCGIVYLPMSPYLLCLSTFGENVSHQKASIKEISALVFKQMSTESIYVCKLKGCLGVVSYRFTP